jgi:hypothetical protein
MFDFLATGSVWRGFRWKMGIGNAANYGGDRRGAAGGEDPDLPAAQRQFIGN